LPSFPHNRRWAKMRTNRHRGTGRTQVLVQRGDAEHFGEGRIPVPRDLLQRLGGQEAERVGRTMVADRGWDWQPVNTGGRFGGELVGSVQLLSDRFAMIDDRRSFSLVPWNDALERRIGQQIARTRAAGWRSGLVVRVEARFGVVSGSSDQWACETIFRQGRSVATRYPEHRAPKRFADPPLQV